MFNQRVHPLLQLADGEDCFSSSGEAAVIFEPGVLNARHGLMKLPCI
jgi:hypothetical protein